MRKGVKIASVFVFFMLISLISISFLSSNVLSKNSVKISQNVLSALEEKEKVRVIIQSDNNVKGTKIAKGVFSAELTKKEIDDLSKNSNIKAISLDQIKHIFLQDTINIVNASITWPVQISSTDLTGIGETICILDTGLNSSHPDLLGKVLDGYNFVSNNSNYSDDHGHGTHVAGIIAANGNITGIAPDANLVAIKVCDAAGACNDADIIRGISWCVDNSLIYNISVISISLGGGEFDSYCDNNETESAYSTPINSAIAKNISVVVASGNYDAGNGLTNYTKISSPACIQNATAVTSADKSDLISSFSKRNSLVDLVAPGTEINSTFMGGTCPSGCSCSGNYMICSGTSMAAPHVAAAIAILQQAKKLRNDRSYLPSEVISILQSKGKQINDTTGNGLNYSRIDIYSSILTTFNPTYVNPSTSINYLDKFSIIWTDELNISAVTAEFNGTNYTGENIIRLGNTYSLNKTFAVGNHTLKWYANDTSGNLNHTDNLNVIINKASPQLNLIFNFLGMQYSSSIIVDNPTEVNISATSSGESNIQLYQDGILINNGTTPVSNTLIFSTGIYNISVSYLETQNYTASSASHIISVEYPNQPSNNTYSNNTSVTFWTNMTDASLKNETINIWNSTNFNVFTNTTNITGMSSEINWTYTLPYDDKFKWNIYVCDNSNNCGWTGSNLTLIMDTTNPDVSFDDTDYKTDEGDAITITCSVNDANLNSVAIYVDDDLKKNFTTSEVPYTYPATILGTHPVDCIAYDKAGNSGEESDTITVSPSSSGTTSGGTTTSDDDSGGSGSTETTSHSKSFPLLRVREAAILTPSSDLVEKTTIQEISVSSVVENKNVIMGIGTATAADAKTLSNSYKFFSVTVYNIDEEFIADAGITFEVAKSWIQNNNYNKTTVKLNRYHDSDWQKLSTRFLSETNTSYVYRAETPGFSIFGINADKAEVIPVTSTPKTILDNTTNDRITGGVISIDKIIKELKKIKLIYILIAAGAILIMFITRIIIVRRKKLFGITIKKQESPKPKISSSPASISAPATNPVPSLRQTSTPPKLNLTLKQKFHPKVIITDSSEPFKKIV